MALLRSAGTSTGGSSPVKGVYPMEIISFSDFERREGLKFRPEDKDKINIQCRVEFRFFEYPYDPQVDDKDWDGETVTEYFVFQKEEYHLEPNPRDPANPIVVTDRVLDSYLDDRSSAFKLLESLMGRAPTREDEIDLNTYEGVRLDVGVEPKKSGWPSLKSFARRRTARARVAVEAPAPEPAPVRTASSSRRQASTDDLAGTVFADDEE